MVQSPTLLEHIDFVTAIEGSASLSFTAVLTGSVAIYFPHPFSEEGSIYTFGSCEDGELGHGRAEHATWQPILIRTLESKVVSAISAGGFHFLALLGLPLQILI